MKILAVLLIIGGIIGLASGLSMDTIAKEPAFKNEKNALLNTNAFGDWRKAKIAKKSGKITLELWRDRAEFLKKKLGIVYDIPKLEVEYDEIWERKKEDYLTKEELRKWQKDLNILRFYWKGDKIQGYSENGKFISNPLTGENFSAPIWKIILIADREKILNELNK